MARIAAQWICLLCLSLPLVAGATSPYRAVQQWTAADGLPAETIAGLAIDVDLQLWLATYDGVVRYQGFDFQHYNRDSDPALPGNRLMAIHTAPGEGVVVHFEDGSLGHLSDRAYVPIGRAEAGHVAVFDHQVWFIDAHSSALWAWRQTDGARMQAGFELSALHVDTFAARLLLGARDGRVLVLSGQDGTIEALSVSLPVSLPISDQEPILGLATGPEDRLLVLDARGARLLERGKTGHTAVPIATWKRQQGRALRATWTERGWLLANLSTATGTRPHRIRHSGIEALEIADATSVDADRSPSRIHLVDARGRRWVNDGLNLFRDGQLVFRASQRIRDFAVDPFDQVWIAQPTQGLRLLKQSLIETVGHGPHGLPDPNINLVTELDGDVLVGSWAALSRLDRATGKWTHLLRRAARDVIPDGEGLLVGSRGLCRLEAPGHCTEVPNFPGGNAEVLMLHRDAGGAVWAGTDAGLYRRAPSGRWQSEAIDPATVRSALEDPFDRLLLGTNGDGLLVLAQRGDFRQPLIRIGPDQGLASAFVRSLLGLPGGATLVGTEDAGLCLLNARLEVVRCLSSAGGLPHHSVHYMLVDPLDRLWVNTNAGIYRVDLASLLSFLERRSESIPAFSRLGERQGLLSVEGNGGVNRAGAITDDGRIWFPNQLGLVAIRPAPEALHPDVPLTARIRVVGSSTSGPPRLHRHARQLDLELSAIALANPQDVQFRYRLDPDSAWQELGHQRQINFRELPPGRHRLDVGARYPHTPWAGTPAQLNFTADYRLHEHPAFRGMLFALALLAVVAVWLITRRWKRHLERSIEQRSAQLDQATEQLSRLTGSLRRVDFQHRTALQAISRELKAALDALLDPLLRQHGGPVPEQRAEKLRAQARTLNMLIEQIDGFGDPASPDAEIETPKRRAPARGLEQSNGQNRTDAGRGGPGLDMDLKARIRMLVLLHMGDPNFSVDELAKQLGMSRSVLYRRVAEFHDASPAELIRELRLKRAAELLIESDEQVSTIAYATGFRSVSAFSRAFVKMTKTTPREWRNRSTG